tara:strand:- start:738 stop:1112 length:375 start_codon:yes stop_codon:yes gene_type:complete
MTYPLMAIALFGRDPETVPHLRKEDWKRWAASVYRRQAAVGCVVPLPMSPRHEANRAYAKAAQKKQRMLCAALCARADALGYRDFAQQWADRFWEGYELDATAKEIEDEYKALLERELAFRALR